MEKRYQIIDINVWDEADIEVVEESATLDDIRGFLEGIWANHSFGDEDIELVDYTGKTIDELNQHLEGVGYWAEEVK